MPGDRKTSSRSASPARTTTTKASVGTTVCRYGATSATVFEGAETGALSSAADIAPAVERLRATFDSDKTLSLAWRVGQLQAMRRMVTEGRGELCEAMQIDLHKSAFESEATELLVLIGEIDTALAHLRAWMKPAYTDSSALNIPCWSYTQRDPLGVVLVMGAWNYPTLLTLGPVVGAIAGGNCVVIKPGAYARASSHSIARLVLKYMDPSSVAVAEGDRTVTAALLENRFDKICFTGSGYVGKIVAAAAAKQLTPCLLELGGKSPCIIDRSADLAHAAKRFVWAAFVNGGQTCVRPDFLMVHEAVADAFLAQVRRCVQSFYGDAQATEWFGRCINDAAFARLAALVSGAAEHVVIGGHVDKADRFIAPTILDYGSDLGRFKASEAMQDENFGPVVPAVRFQDVEQVVELVRGLPTGKPLALYAFSRDAAFCETIRRRTTSGALNINDCLMHMANNGLPFGGVGASGMGAYHGEHSFKAFTHEKAVLEKSQALDALLTPLLDLRFPPYTPLKQRIVKALSMRAFELLVNVHRHTAFWLLLLAYAGYAAGLRITWAA